MVTLFAPSREGDRAGRLEQADLGHLLALEALGERAPSDAHATIAVSRARRSTKSTIAGSSITGSVSGWQTMVVTPPAAAAWLAEASVSRCSAPGSPMKARMSTRPGATTLAVAVDDLGAFRHAGRADAALGLADHAVGDQQVAGEIEVARRIDDARVGEQDRAAVGQHAQAFGKLRDSASSTAMRTATPISTCSRISDCAPSATAESISTPRFIGPGCITSASGLA